MKKNNHCSEKNLSLQWKLQTIAMKTFNHCDENFLSFDSVQKTSLLCMVEKAFIQMEKDFPFQPKFNNRFGKKLMTD